VADEDKENQEGEAPADGAAAPEGEQVATKKWTGKKLALIIGVPLLLIIIGGAGAYFAGVFGHEKTPEEIAAEEEAKKQVDPNAAPTFYNVPDMVVNMQAERGRPVYLKISLSLELSTDKDIPAVERVLPRVLDNFQLYLRELRVDELRGSTGMYRLREELLMRVNLAVQPVKVKDVLFREMLVQ